MYLSTPQPSKEKDYFNDRFRIKVRAVGVFLKHIAANPFRGFTHNQLKKFVAARKKSTKNLWWLLTEQMKEENAENYRQRPKTTVTIKRSPSCEDESHPWITPSELVNMKECDSQCHLCHEAATFDGFPCRVCSRTFHRVCLEHCGRYKPGELSLLNNAHSNTGWSCYECDDIPRLLTDQEMKHLIEEFDRYDINRDAGISQDEFSRVRHDQHQQIENEAMSKEEEDRTLLEFRLMDQDNDGIIDWWEFLKHEACKVLAKRDPMELVGLLKQKEVLVAKQLFSTFDDNGDGRISEYEVKKAYRHWFQHFDHICKPDDSSKRTGAETPALTLLRDSSSLNLHVEQQSSVLMSADTRNTGVITWDDFIKDQALYLICSRPNRSIFTCH